MATKRNFTGDTHSTIESATRYYSLHTHTHTYTQHEITLAVAACSLISFHDLEYNCDRDKGIHFIEYIIHYYILCKRRRKKIIPIAVSELYVIWVMRARSYNLILKVELTRSTVTVKMKLLEAEQYRFG